MFAIMFASIVTIKNLIIAFAKYHATRKVFNYTGIVFLALKAFFNPHVISNVIVMIVIIIIEFIILIHYFYYLMP